MTRQVRIHEDPTAVARAAADEFVRRRPRTIALAGGSTPKALYALLAGAALPWSEMHFFWSDERLVPPGDPESNYRMAHEALLSRVPVPAANVHRVRTELPDDEAARAYELDIRDHLGPQTRFDLILLGLGPDAHTASLFPGSPALRERARLIAPVVASKPPPRRVTFTPPLLNAAASILFLACGAEKSEALKGVLEGPRDPDRYPAQAVAPADGEVLWLIDRAAAGRLERTP